MGKLINCECGQVVRGKSDDELVALDDDSVDDDVLALEVLLAEELPLLSVL